MKAWSVPVVLKVAFVSSALLVSPASAVHAGNLQEDDLDRRHIQRGESIGGGLSNPAPAASDPILAARRPPVGSGQPPAAEYRGYNGRTLEQAYYKCKYDAWRTAPPGDRGKGMFEKVRMRAFAMESCMNSEGFFRNKPSPRFDSEFITSTDVLDSIFAK